MKARALLALLVLLAPLASAAAVAGTLTASAINATAAVYRAHPQGAFLDDFSGLQAWQLRASRVDVQVFNRTSMTTPITRIQDPTEHTAEASYSLHDVAATLLDASPQPQSFFGLYDTAGSMVEGLDGQDVSWTPSQGTTLGAGGDSSPEPTPDPALNHFNKPVAGPTLVYEARGRFGFSGDLVMKFRGLNLTLQARENTSILQTYHANVGVPVGTSIDVWAYVTLTNATLTLQTRAPLKLASSDVVILSCDALGLEATGGQVEVDGQPGTPEGAARFVGRLSARLVAGQEGGSADASVSLEGDAAVEGVRYAPVSPAAARSGLAFAVGLLLLGSVAVAGGVAAWRLTRRARAPPLSVEECIDLAERAMEQHAWGVALEWNGRALLQVPDHPRLLADRGTILEALARVEEAVEAYRRAAAAGRDGEGEILLARLLLRFDPASVEACQAIVGALAKSPEMVYEVEAEPEYRVARGQARVQAALREAHRATERR